jgi:hypothetical protein
LAWLDWAPAEPDRADERRELDPELRLLDPELRVLDPELRVLDPELRLEFRLAPAPPDLARPDDLDAEDLDPPDRLDPPDDDFDAGMVWLLLAKFEIERTQTGCGRFHNYPFLTNSRSAFWAWRRFSA